LTEIPPPPKKRISQLALVLFIIGILSGSLPVYVVLQQQVTHLQDEVKRFRTSYEETNSSLVVLQNDYENLEVQYNNVSFTYYKLKNDYNSLQSRYSRLQFDYGGLESQVSNLEISLAIWQELHIGTALETYYDYVRANCITLNLEPVGEERWWTFPNYYNLSVDFAANLAAHDAGDLWWPSLDESCNYWNYTGEYS